MNSVTPEAKRAATGVPRFVKRLLDRDGDILDDESDDGAVMRGLWARWGMPGGNAF
tara:strand:- start:913 stop:1080 length:168 start_codon:yes stop_codon:yes gene_type:complete